jgi:hypothetical protein
MKKNKLKTNNEYSIYTEMKYFASRILICDEYSILLNDFKKY